jgi:CelD/BcsL family acetyltransferase involved in cellulose biosynthesis
LEDNAPSNQQAAAVPASFPLTDQIFGAIEAAPDALAALTRLLRPPRPGGASNVTVYAGDDAVERVRGIWRALEFSGARSTAFQSLAMAEATCEAHRRKGETPLIVVAARHGRPVLLFPAVVGRARGLRGVRFLGDPLIQYGDVLAAPDATAEDFAAAWREIANPRHGHYVHLRKVRADAAMAPFLERNACIVATHRAPYRCLESAAERGSRKAKDLRRRRRRLAEYGDVAFRILRGRHVAEALHAALTRKRDWLAGRGLSSAVVGDPDWEHSLYRLSTSPRGAIRLAAAQLEVDGKPAATEIAIEDGRRWCAFLGATDPAFARAGPGHVQIDETVAWCAAQGYAEYDLLAPADDYKRAIANNGVEVRDYALATCLRGKAAISALRAAPAVKEGLARLPAGPRAALGRWLRALAH